MCHVIIITNIDFTSSQKQPGEFIHHGDQLFLIILTKHVIILCNAHQDDNCQAERYGEITSRRSRKI